MNDSSSSDNAIAELEAMRVIYEALRLLDANSQRRVLAWVSSRTINSSAPSFEPTEAASRQPEIDGQQAEDLPTFYAKANPELIADKALVVAYWLQVFCSQEDLDSQQINTELKNLGHGLGNVTRTMDALVNSRPQFVIQTRKEGPSKQARKKYRVTQEGTKRVKSLLANNGGGSVPV